MSTFSDIHHQTWMAFHRAMLSDVPMSVLHPGFPAPHPHVEDRVCHDSLEALRDEEEYYMGDPDEWSEEDDYDDWPVPTYPEPTDEEMDEWEERNRRRIAEQNEY